jgi:hypothetical protein
MSHASPTIPSNDMLLVVINVIITTTGVYGAGIINIRQSKMKWAVVAKHCDAQLIDIVLIKRQDSKGGNTCILLESLFSTFLAQIFPVNILLTCRRFLSKHGPFRVT